MGITESRITTDTKLKRITWLSQQDATKTFGSLMHLINEASLQDCFNQLDGKKAVGIDGIDKTTYQENLEDNLRQLVKRMKCMAYRPQPVKQVVIPKEGQPSKTRLLGISSLEDKIVQKMLQKILESIYEPLFLECSYGFRPGRGCHEAIRALHQYLYRNNVHTVIDVDVANFFGTIQHGELVKILRGKITDERFIRYIIRNLKAGILVEGELKMSEEGVAQGSIVSPILTNIFAHYVIDKWFEETVKKHCQGKVKMFRYGDDICVCCEYEHDAKRIYTALGKRFAKYALTLQEGKTKLVSFSRKEKQAATFDFLGFTFYWGYSRKGVRIPKVKTSGKRMRLKLKKVNQWAKAIRNKIPLTVIWKQLGTKISGHIHYYGVSFNKHCLVTFIHQTEEIMFKWLNRRSQRRSFTWDKFQLFMKANPLPQVKIYHTLF